MPALLTYIDRDCAMKCMFVFPAVLILHTCKVTATVTVQVCKMSH